jgi:hypothetical protein
MPNSFKTSDPSQPTGTQGTSFQEENAPTDPGNVPKSGGQSPSDDYAIVKKRLDDSQNFIQQLKDEAKEQRDVIAQLTEKVSNTPSYDIDEIVDKVNQLKGTPDQGVDPEELVTKVFDRMSDKQKEDEQTANFKLVAETLQKQFGNDTVDAKVSELAKENGMSLEDVFNLAKNSPKAVYKLLGVSNTAATSPTPSQGNVNPQGFTQTPEQALPNIMSVNNDRDRVNLFNKKMEQSLAKLK